MIDPKTENEKLVDHFLSSGGTESLEQFAEKPLALSQLCSQPKFEHFYSQPIDYAGKTFRFYINVAKPAVESPVLWLSRRKYKTCRDGHKYFQVLPLALKKGEWVARWRNTLLFVSPDFSRVRADTDNQTDTVDMWFVTDKRSKTTREIALNVGRKVG